MGKTLSAAEHARILYGRALTELRMFREVNDEIAAILDAELRQTPGSPKTAEIRADERATKLGLASARGRYRDNVVMYGIMYLVESDYVHRTSPFTNGGDRYQREGEGENRGS